MSYTLKCGHKFLNMMSPLSLVFYTSSKTRMCPPTRAPFLQGLWWFALTVSQEWWLFVTFEVPEPKSSGSLARQSHHVWPYSPRRAMFSLRSSFEKWAPSTAVRWMFRLKCGHKFLNMMSLLSLVFYTSSKTRMCPPTRALFFRDCGGLLWLCHRSDGSS